MGRAGFKSSIKEGNKKKQKHLDEFIQHRKKMKHMYEQFKIKCATKSYKNYNLFKQSKRNQCSDCEADWESTIVDCTTKKIIIFIFYFFTSSYNFTFLNTIKKLNISLRKSKHIRDPKRLIPEWNIIRKFSKKGESSSVKLKYCSWFLFHKRSYILSTHQPTSLCIPITIMFVIFFFLQI